ncbi:MULTISPECIES: DNA polymerase III subunit chi [Psychrobacter]|uniref:DNA polymerase III subunit chi n=2 Tax=Psychrobacter TaxID=497 RepID=A0A0T6DMX8_9GAMM|nr:MULTISPECIES: DNA polymerase III subunit chi [Psychrobacter]KRU21342.1 DNA polymerase III subunit chi [Psychrobacter piscatorii]MDH4903686.1 DNA polymerase III subunit chi [Psychrobacter pocilloporae]HBL97853.1 DNA polymerase III subunit chi [Psychrobacter sp.]HCI30948.1 DNA polymerase III subunit chi [Psychrobacter sp.]
MKISFYVLSESKAQDFLGFICQLTQTALNKSTQSLLILIEDETLLAELDRALWAQDATSFIPHQCLSDIHSKAADSDADKSLAPVLLGSYMPADFNGIVLNTTTRPVTGFMATTNNAKPSRVLELIRPDATSTQEGRHKYKAYQQLGYELTHFRV